MKKTSDYLALHESDPTQILSNLNFVNLSLTQIRNEGIRVYPYLMTTRIFLTHTQKIRVGFYRRTAPILLSLLTRYCSMKLDYITDETLFFFSFLFSF